MLSDEAKQMFVMSDVIQSIWQGNYESLSGQGWHIFYSLLCKRNLFTERFHVPKLSGIFVDEKGDALMNREQMAREKHKKGNNCASSVYSSFSDIVLGTAPLPRSEGGKCGAVLAAEKVLTQSGIPLDGFDERFAQMFGSLRCAELRAGRTPCNDLIGMAAKWTEKAVIDDRAG